MPSVTFDSRSLVLGSSRGQSTRLALVAAAFDPTLVDPSRWEAELRALRHAGFNAVAMRVPWLMHEPTPDRFVFEGACAVRRAVELAGAAGLKVLLRIGPCVGGSFAGGGMPAWIAEHAGDRVREANPAFLERVARFWRRLAPHFIDLQATRNANGSARPVVAVGLDDDWRSLDAEVGHAYFAALVRFARECGIEVPLFTANNCWYMHEGVIDAWQDAAIAPGTADELRQVEPNAPPFLIHARAADAAGRLARNAAQAVAERADAVHEVCAARHLGATSAAGMAEFPAADLFAMRRALVFHSTFGEILTGLRPIDGALQGGRGERITVAFAASPGERTAKGARTAPKAVHRCADGSAFEADLDADGVAEFLASDLRIAGARLERCTGSLVALAGDLLVVAGRARSKVRVKIDGSDVALPVPADGAAPKVSRVRGLRVAVVPFGLARGVGIGERGFEFVDARGGLLATIGFEGDARKAKPAAAAHRGAARPIALSALSAIVEKGLVDGTHPRFASVAAPAALGAYGVQAGIAYYRVRHRKASKAGRVVEPVAMRACVRRAQETDAKGRVTEVLEVRDAGLSAQGPTCGARVGMFGPLAELAPLKGVKCAAIELPEHDATRIGRFVHGYDARDGGAHASTLRWTFAPRTRAVLVRFPSWWFESLRGRASHRLRLNDALVPAFEMSGSAPTVLLDGALLSPMRPKKPAKGEKPAKAKNAKLEPVANELVLDLHGDAGDLKRLAKEVELLDVVAEVPAECAFARIEPPASWATAKAVTGKFTGNVTGKVTSNLTRNVTGKATGTPTWFRCVFAQAEASEVELEIAHAAGALGVVVVNGARAMTLDGASGERRGKSLVRRVRVMACAGANAIEVFSPEGAMPALSVRPA